MQAESWARATFEQGCLSVLPQLEGPCKAISLPGEHLFQASHIAPDFMRPVIFHAFGKAAGRKGPAGAISETWMGNPTNCTSWHASLPSCVVPGDMETHRWVLLYGRAKCAHW